jgi:hypothetical protein
MVFEASAGLFPIAIAFAGLLRTGLHFGNQRIDHAPL